MDKPRYIVFDFDHTLYLGDCTIDIALFTYKKYPSKSWYIIVQLLAYLGWKLSFISTQTFKQLFLGFLNGLNETQIHELIAEFWKTAKWNDEILSILHQKQQQDFTCVIITASPEWFVSPIVKSKFDCHTIGTPIALIHSRIKLTGANCKGVEKVNRFNSSFGVDAILAEAYSDNASDKHLFNRAEKAYKIVGKKSIPQQ